MTDRSTLDAFEKRIVAGLERYVAPATDPKPVAEVARIAMRPRGLGVRVRNASPRRRMLLLGLAATLAVPAAYIAGTQRPVLEVVQPSPSADARPITDGSMAIFVRRTEGSEPGVSIYAVRADGSEVLLRTVPDSILAGEGIVGEWATVSASGWLALGAVKNGGPWPLILVDLGDAHAQPWVISEANLGGIGARWGPTGLIAASSDFTSTLVIVDPVSHTKSTVSMQGHGLVGGGPSIVWTASGDAIVGSTGSGSYEAVPIDGGEPRPVTGIFDSRGTYGPGLAELHVEFDRVDRIEPGASDQTIWTQDGDDRALAASFGRGENEYWLALDHDKGRQVALVHVHDGRQDIVATVNRAADWQDVSAPVESPDRSTLQVWIDVGGTSAALLVSLNGVPPSFHAGHFAGFVDGKASPLLAIGAYGAPAETAPASGEAYRLQSLDELIAAELALNPGRHVLGTASHDGVDGDLDVETSEVQRDRPGAGDVYLDCLGPTSVTVTSGSSSVTNACLRAGAYIFQVDATQPVVVTARGDTSWRVVIYSQ